MTRSLPATIVPICGYDHVEENAQKGAVGNLGVVFRLLFGRALAKAAGLRGEIMCSRGNRSEAFYSPDKYSLHLVRFNFRRPDSREGKRCVGDGFSPSIPFIP
jgi:hypothetical protein